MVLYVDKTTEIMEESIKNDKINCTYIKTYDPKEFSQFIKTNPLLWL